MLNSQEEMEAERSQLLLRCTVAEQQVAQLEQMLHKRK
jgi:hypothetical protein